MSLAEQFKQGAIDFARRKVPYQHRGTSGFGCDCTGLIIALARRAGFMKRYTLRFYEPDWNMHARGPEYVANDLLLIADEVPKSEARPGDIVAFRFGKRLAHTGILIENNLFIHAIAGIGRVSISALHGTQWSKRWSKAYRLNEDKMAKFS